ncbi:hypothetical protein ERJ75_001607900 [Trypanosoma vivax]|nr:hypothetical protein ERJ75_001607900 [Trypanosoma vivax]
MLRRLAHRSTVFALPSQGHFSLCSAFFVFATGSFQRAPVKEVRVSAVPSNAALEKGGRRSSRDGNAEATDDDDKTEEVAPPKQARRSVKNKTSLAEAKSDAQEDVAELTPPDASLHTDELDGLVERPTAAPKKDESQALLEIDALRVLKEWDAVCADTSLEESDKSPGAPEVIQQGSVPPSHTTSAAMGATTTAKVAALGARLTRAVKLRRRYPALHAVLSAHERSRMERGRVCTLHMAEVAQATEKLCAFFSFLRVYRTSPFHSFVVYKAVVDQLMQHVVSLQSSVDATSSCKDQWQCSRLSAKRALLWLALELRQSYLEISAALRSPNPPVERTKKVNKRKNDDTRHKKWLEDVINRFIESVAIVVTEEIVAGKCYRKLHSITGAVVDIAVISLTSVLVRDHQSSTQSTAKKWDETVSRLQAAVAEYLGSSAIQNACGPVVDAAKSYAFDMISALRVLAEANTVVPEVVRERLKQDIMSRFQQLCVSVSTHPKIFTDVMCGPDFVQKVETLPSQDLRDLTYAAIVTGAALFCKEANDAAVSALRQSFRTGGKELHTGGSLGPTGDEIETCDEVDSISRFVGPKSRRAIIAFALFYAGYDPESVLRSGFCVGNNAAEVLEILHIAALFSRTFALEPLPPRLSSLLTQESSTLIDARIRTEHRAGSTPTESLEAKKPLREILEGGKQWRNTDVIHSQTKEEPSATGRRRGTVVDLETTLHLAFTTSLELLVRGEEKKLSPHLARLISLLEREGSYHYLVDGFMSLIDEFMERLRVVGTLGCASKTKEQACTSLEVEKSLAEVTALFVPRVVESAQRQLSKAKRSSSMCDAEEQTAQELLQSVQNFTVYVAACGMSETTAKQLVGLHSTVLRGLLSGGQGESVLSLSEMVNRMNVLVSHVSSKQRDLAITRLPGSPAQRYCSIVINDVVAAHLKPIAAAFRGGSSRVETTQDRFHVFSIVGMLFRLASKFAVEAEPGELQAFRTDILDPALTRVLQHHNVNNGETQSEPLDLAALSEITAVMCVPRTIHHLSSQLLDQLTTAVKLAAARESELSCTAGDQCLSSQTAARLLLSAAAVCQLRKEAFTERYMEMVFALAPLLLPRDVSSVLRAFVECHVPTNNEAVNALRGLLADEAQSLNSSLSPQETLSALQVLCELDDPSQKTYTAILRRIVESEHRRGPGEAGILVRIATRLQRLGDAISPDDMKFLQDLPASLAETVLRARQQCPPSELPLVLKGFSQLSKATHGELQSRVMSAYILRTIQSRLLLSAEDVVDCLESYTEAQVRHQYLFGVLLARITDLKSKFSLPLAVRLVRCGVNSTWDKSVQTACITAAQPVFLGLVRHLIQSDPASLPFVAGHSVLVLQCLAEAFPNDPTSSMVLQNMADHRNALSLSAMIAVLQLIVRRSSTEYNILRCMTDHAASSLFPQASPKSFAELTRLFVQCGVRSRTLFDAVGKRFRETAGECDTEVLTTLAEAFTIAHVDLEEGIIGTLTERLIELGEQQSVSFHLAQYVTLLKFFALVSTDSAKHATSLLLKNAYQNLSKLAEAPRSEVCLTPADIQMFLSSAIRVGKERHTELTETCVNVLFEIVKVDFSAEGREQVAAGAWMADLSLIVQLASSVVQLGHAKHPLMAMLLEMLYERRNALMRRRLLLQTTTDVLRVAGEGSHKQLYSLLVEGKLLA